MGTNKMHSWSACAVVAAVLLSLVPGVHAQEKAKVGELVITSKTLTFDYVDDFAVFETNVKVVDPSMVMTCNKLTVYFTEEKDIKNIVAVGSVVITQKENVAYADKAVYGSESELLILVGKPARITSGKSEIVGKKITYFLREKRMVVDADETTSGRVKATIVEQENEGLNLLDR